MAADIEVFIDFAAGSKRVGTLHRQPRRGGEAVSFEYHLSTNITLDEGTCDIGLVESVGEYFALSPSAARAIIKQVAAVTANWREVARAAGASAAEIRRMESAFQHEELEKALAL